MDNRQIKELMAAMIRAGVDKLVWKQEGDFEILLERHPEAHPVIHHAQPYYSPAPFEQDAQRPLPSARGVESTGNAEPSVDAKYITSPMVGTFYASPSPDDPPFVKVGDRVEPGTVVCIIEAMKVMNEVKAGVSGVVTESLVSSSSPVEFGTKLFQVS